MGVTLNAIFKDFISHFNILVWLGLYIGYFVLDFLNTKNVITIQQLKVIPTANISLSTTILATLGTYICVKDSLWNMIPIGLGVYCGSVFALMWEIEIKRREDMRNLNNGKNPVKKIKHRGVHAKTKQSTSKKSKLYKKPSVGQGK
jgi:hypothetical protein